MCNLSLGIAKESAYKGYNKGYNIGVEHGEQIGAERGRVLGIDDERKRMTIGLLKEHVSIPIIISVSGMDEEDVRRIAEEEHLPC